MNVGRYQILETLGTGASSRVVRGYDPLIDRSVAIKLFSPELGRGEGRARFLREARVVGKLSHPFRDEAFLLDLPVRPFSPLPVWPSTSVPFTS